MGRPGADVGEDIRGHVPPSLFFYFLFISYTIALLNLQLNIMK